MANLQQLESASTQKYQAYKTAENAYNDKVNALIQQFEREGKSYPVELAKLRSAAEKADMDVAWSEYTAARDAVENYQAPAPANTAYQNTSNTNASQVVYPTPTGAKPAATEQPYRPEPTPVSLPQSSTNDDFSFGVDTDDDVEDGEAYSPAEINNPYNTPAESFINDPLYEPVPTDDELASTQQQLNESLIAENMIPDSPETNEYFYIDHAEDLDEIAAKYGVDPTSAQAAQIWQDEYGSDVDLNLNTGSFTNTGNVAPPPPPAYRPRSIKDSRRPISNGDWRFRIRLSPFADYLYNAPNPGILAPLKATDGVLFPYTPSITMAQVATYQSYNPTHSNFRGHFFQGSQQSDIIINADFTAQDTNEALYMLAMLHFFRSASKMFYGQDTRRGTPPPLVYLTGLGEYQFNEHPALISVFNYTLPNNVDYIKTSNSASSQYAPVGQSTGSGYESWSSKITRAITSGLEDFITGGLPSLASFAGLSGVTKIVDGATYVPTKLSINLTLLPVNTRQEISDQYSLRDFANGSLLKKGFY